MSFTINNAAELTDYVVIQLSSLNTLISADGYEFAGNKAISELGWSYPVTDPTKALWLINRASRHCVDILRIASANKFKYKLVNLQNRFEHFQKLIETMDKEFEDAMAENPTAFGGVDLYKLFGTKIDAGFLYDIDGADLTYDVRNYVVFTPGEVE
jgi:hypothetical protein